MNQGVLGGVQQCHPRQDLLQPIPVAKTDFNYLMSVIWPEMLSLVRTQFTDLYKFAGITVSSSWPPRPLPCGPFSARHHPVLSPPPPVHSPALPHPVPLPNNSDSTHAPDTPRSRFPTQLGDLHPLLPPHHHANNRTLLIFPVGN
jgi:hypothetical protein